MLISESAVGPFVLGIEGFTKSVRSEYALIKVPHPGLQHILPTNCVVQCEVGCAVCAPRSQRTVYGRL